MSYIYREGKWLTAEPPKKEGWPTAGLRDLYGRGEFLVNDHGTMRITSGWRDWRSHCKSNGLVEVSTTDKGAMQNTAPKKAAEKLRATLPKAIDSAIEKVRHKPYFDKRIIGRGSRISHAEIKKDIHKESIRQLREKETVHA